MVKYLKLKKIKTKRTVSEAGSVTQNTKPWALPAAADSDVLHGASESKFYGKRPLPAVNLHCGGGLHTNSMHSRAKWPIVDGRSVLSPARAGAYAVARFRLSPLSLPST